MRVLFAGGGTAGHINPAIAVANVVKEREPGAEILFVGTKHGMESSLVPGQGYDIKFIEIHGFERKLSLKNIKTVCEIFSGIKNAKRIIKEFKPDVVMGTGGYVTGPVLFAASQLKTPTLVHEANAYPGLTIRILSRFADVVALSMKEAADFLPQNVKTVVTGNPIRPSILRINKADAKRKLNLDSRSVILIFGGSLGANAINRAACEWIVQNAPKRKFQVLMSTGKNNQFEKVMAFFGEKGFNLEDYPEIRVSEYIYDMDYVLNAADLVIARSGGSVSEMTALGKPAILIPSPYVAGNHQEHNARAVEKAGGAIVIKESELTQRSLSDAISEILDNPKKLISMQKGSKSVGTPFAADKLCDMLYDLQRAKN